ncbi:MAG: hypothetical protein ACOZAN_03910 [Patescibacteria group bacterium]
MQMIQQDDILSLICCIVDAMNDQNANAQRPLSSKEFLEQRRQRRLEGRQSASVQPGSVQPGLVQAETPQRQSAQSESIGSVSNRPGSFAPEQTSTQQNYDLRSAEQYQDQDLNNSYINSLPMDFSPEQSRIAPGLYKPIPEQELFAWEAPSRPFKKRNRKFFVNITVIAALLSMIFVFIGQILPVAVVFSVVFLVYILSVIPPQMVEVKITNYGIRVEDVLYYWEEMGNFWLEEKYGQNMLFIEIGRFPGRLSLMLGETSPELITELLSEVLLNKRPELTAFEKGAKWLQEKFPLEA